MTVTDKPDPCPRCGCTVSDAATYFFIPSEELRWHQLCYIETHPELFKDEMKEETQ